MMIMLIELIEFGHWSFAACILVGQLEFLGFAAMAGAENSMPHII